MFADRILEKLYDGYEKINTNQKVDYLLLLMRANNVTITDDFVYYCEELMKPSIYEYFISAIEDENRDFDLRTVENIAIFFSMIIGLGFGISNNLRSMIKYKLSKREYHKFHIAQDFYYTLLGTPHYFDVYKTMSHKVRMRAILDYLEEKITKEEEENLRKERKMHLELLRRINATRQHIDKASIERQNRIEKEESEKRRANRARIAKRAGLNRESSNSIWSTNIILTNMGGKR